MKRRPRALCHLVLLWAVSYFAAATTTMLPTSMTYTVFPKTEPAQKSEPSQKQPEQQQQLVHSAPVFLAQPLASLRSIDLTAFKQTLPYCYGCAVAGAISTALSHTATLPLDVLKTKMQSDRALAGLSPAQALRRVVRDGGPSQLLTGFSANAIGYFSQGAIKFGLYEQGKMFFSDAIQRKVPNADVSETRWRVPIWIASSACAEVVACIALCPMEATKIRMVTDAGYARGTLGALRRILFEEGLRALFRGASPIMIRQVPYTVAKLAGYEALSMCCGGGLVSGVVAGALAAAVSQPGDVSHATFLFNSDIMPTQVILSKLCGGSKVARLETCHLSVPAVVESLSIRELYVGLTPRATMCAAICAGQFFLYEALRPPKPAYAANLAGPSAPVVLDQDAPVR